MIDDEASEVFQGVSTVKVFNDFWSVEVFPAVPRELYDQDQGGPVHVLLDHRSVLYPYASFRVHTQFPQWSVSMFTCSTSRLHFLLSSGNLSQSGIGIGERHMCDML
jgi:hypothetical protein